MNIKSFGKKLLVSGIAASVILGSFPIPYKETPIGINLASAAGTRLTGFKKDATMQTYLNIPSNVTLEFGNLKPDREDVLRPLYYGWNAQAKSRGGGSYLKSGEDIKNYYYAQDIPFQVTIAGKQYVIYCAQSQMKDGHDLNFSGIVTDPRVYALLGTNARAVDSYDPNTAGREAANQLVLWGALNSNFSPNLFTNGINANAADFANTNYKTVIGFVNDIKSKWPQIVSSSSPVKVVPIIPSSNTPRVIKSQATKTAIVELGWKFADGSSINDLSKVADITYTGMPPGVEVIKGTDPSAKTKLGITPKKNVIYLKHTNVPIGTIDYKVTPKVTYKSEYKALNDFVLAYYESSIDPAKHQPFVLPVEIPKQKEIQVKYAFSDDPKIITDDQNVEVSGNVKTTDLRWYNMPSAFGEIKNGVGYNSGGETIHSSFASTRSQEPFEAMLGVPSTERFYVNLGGTEGILDVKYQYVEAQQEFAVMWKTPWEKLPPPGSPPGTPAEKGEELFNDTVGVDFKAMHLDSASFRVMGNGNAENDQLGISVEIENSANINGSFTLQPSASGLEIGPGVGTSNYNTGVTSSMATKVDAGSTPKVTGRKATKSDGQDTAYGIANGQIGQVFAQNDALTITINGKPYSFVTAVNQKTATVFGGSSSVTVDSTNGSGKSFFKPVGDHWDVWSHVPVKGYTGNPEDDGQRNIGGPILKSENISIDYTLGNGIYPFEDFTDKNYITYEAVTTIKGTADSLHEDISELDSGNAKGSSASYKSAKDPTSLDNYVDGDKVMTQYTNWQVPTSTGPNGLTFKHSGKEPDGSLDASLGDNPAYKSINPVLIHTPVSNMYARISDIPDSTLKDQRIASSAMSIEPHVRSTISGGSEAPARQYVDYDFKVTIPNTGAFDKYWSQTAANSDKTGIVDTNYTSPGTIGKGYKGSALAKNSIRSYENPYTSGAGQWDVSKWINAKYVMFPYEVYYYKNSGEVGGNDPGFYPAGTWIKLYDDNQSVHIGDVTDFNFHVVSNAKDIKDGTVYFTTEAINAPSQLLGNGEELYLAGEQYANGTRKTSGSSLGSYSTERDGEAAYSSDNSLNVDLIGRIGNVLVSDTTDPAWSSVFWKTKSGQIQTQDPVSKDYGSAFNMFETLTNPNSSGFSAYNRYRTLDAWHAEAQPIHTLPLGLNVLTKSQTNQSVKMGYNIKGSVQTLGDYDYSMLVYPQNMLAGTFTTGKPGDPFKLLTSDPYRSGAVWKEYYNSNVNNSISGMPALLGSMYKPAYDHIISSTLADPRAKMSPWEGRTPEYKEAVRKGVASKVTLGTPSWIKIPQSMRTWIGSTTSEGRWGTSGENTNNSMGAKSSAATCNCPQTLTNVHKWNWDYSLPQNTKVWFYNNKAGRTKSGSPVLEKQTKNQYIYTTMVFRTKVDRADYPGSSDSWQTSWRPPAIQNGDRFMVKAAQSIPDWDLTMYTNTGAGGVPDLISTVRDLPKGLIPGTGQNGTWDPTQSPGYSSPKVPIAFWNYSQPASTDKDNIGSH